MLADECDDEPCDDGCSCDHPAPVYTSDHTGTVCPECDLECWATSPALDRRAAEHAEAVKQLATRTGTASVAVPQAEIDAQGRQVYVRKGAVLRGIAKMLDDDRLTDKSQDILRWYAEAIGKAETHARLDELAESAKGEKIRHRHWWQGTPAAITAVADDGEVYEAEIVDDSEPLAIAAPPRPAFDLAAELAARGYAVQRDAPAGRCSIIEAHTGPCCLAGPNIISGFRFCDGHKYALTNRKAS